MPIIVKAKTLISASRLLLHLLDNLEIEALYSEPGDQRSKHWDSGSNPESWQPYIWPIEWHDCQWPWTRL